MVPTDANLFTPGDRSKSPNNHPRRTSDNSNLSAGPGFYSPYKGMKVMPGQNGADLDIYVDVEHQNPDQTFSPSQGQSQGHGMRQKKRPLIDSDRKTQFKSSTLPSRPMQETIGDPIGTYGKTDFFGDDHSLLMQGRTDYGRAEQSTGLKGLGQ
jgi:hypothetical protein